MRVPPNYPTPPNVKPINWKRWGQGFITVMALALLITNFFWPKELPTKSRLFWFISLTLPAFIYLLVFSIYYFIYQIRIYHKNIYIEVTQQDEKQWWDYQSKYLPIIDAIIIGCLGSKQTDWQMLIRNRIVPPPPEISGEKQILRCPILMGDQKNKDEMLAKLLVNEFKFKHMNSNLNIKHIYWLGTESTLAIFSNLFNELYSNTPIDRNLIHSIDDLDNIIDNHYEHYSDNEQLIIAGTNLFDKSEHVTQSESGFLWLIGNTGNYAIHRGETIDAHHEDINQLTTHLKRYANLETAPNLTISMDSDSAIAFASTDWDCIDNVLFPYYGGVTRSSPFLAISQSTIHCIQNNVDSCGWTSNIIDNRHLAGVISRHE